MQTVDLVTMSLTGSGMVMAVVLARALLLKRLPKQTFVILWALVALRLLMPLAIPAPVNAYSLLSMSAQAVAEKVELLFEQADTGSTATPESSQSQALQEEGGGTVTVAGFADGQDASGGGEGLANPMHVVWGAGTIVAAGAFLVTHARLRKRLAESLPVRDDDALDAFAGLRNQVGVRRRVDLRQSELVGTPLTFGVVRPVVIVPKTCPDARGWAGERMRFVLAHELCHVRRCDVALKCVLAAAVCLHWFNPLAWVMWVLAARDIELACDEAAVRSLARGPLGQVRAEYARTLIDMEEMKSGLAPLGVCNAFNRTAMEERVVAIMHIKKTTCAALLASSLLVVGVPAAFASTTYWGLPSGGQVWHFTYDADSVKETSEGDVTAAFDRLVFEQAAEGGARVYSSDASGKNVSDVTAAAVPGSSATLGDLAIKSLTITDAVATNTDATAAEASGDAVATSTDATAVEASDTDGLSDTAQAFGSNSATDDAVAVEVDGAGSIGVATRTSDSGVAADDVSLEELFAPYAQYGLSFDAKSGTFTYTDPADSGARPQHVSVFVSSSETEDVLSDATVYSDGTDDGLKLRAVYDKAGALVGLKEFEGDLGFSLSEE